MNIESCVFEISLEFEMDRSVESSCCWVDIETVKTDSGGWKPWGF